MCVGTFESRFGFMLANYNVDRRKYNKKKICSGLHFQFIFTIRSKSEDINDAVKDLEKGNILKMNTTTRKSINLSCFVKFYL